RLYGRPSLVVKDLLEKVRRTPAPRPENLDELITFGLTVQHFCDYLSKTDLEHYLMNMEMLEEMVEKLPATRKLEWVRYSRKYPNPSLKEFGWFMEKLVDEACEVTKYTPLKANPPKRVHHSNVHTHAATTPAMPQEEPEAASSRPYAVIAYQPPPCLNCGKTGHRFQMHRNGSQTTLFRVVPVTLYNGNKRIDTHAFFDEGSSLTLVESSLAETLGLEGVPDPLALRWTANVGRKEATSRKISSEISGRGDERRYSIAAAHIVNELSLPSNNVKIKTLISSYYYLQGLPVKAYEDGVPRLLIGLKDVDLMKLLETRSGQPGEPNLSLSRQCLVGRCTVPTDHKCKSDKRLRATCTTQCDNVAMDAALNETLRRFFTLEETGVSTYSEFLPKPKDIVRANEILENTTERLNGRFVTGLLWKSEDVSFPDSVAMATKRLHALERKLERGYAHKATEEELATADPKPDKKRLVWDAAAKVKDVSLNTQLIKGPDLLVALPGVLSFNMRNWLSNEDAVLESLVEETGEKQRVIHFGQEENHPRVLGLIWDPASDTFRFSIN
uniref:Peptidase aspartic putative domain-containing protein n=1 Tax=Anopheles epiroticus TaxID=199890 RepID=A0A182PX54_9DIPT